MNDVLKSYIEIVPVIKDAFGMDIMMSVTDGYEFLAYWRGDKMVADIHDSGANQMPVRMRRQEQGGTMQFFPT